MNYEKKSLSSDCSFVDTCIGKIVDHHCLEEDISFGDIGGVLLYSIKISQSSGERNGNSPKLSKILV